MITRVNLLKRHEERYQGAVSRRFIALLGIGGTIGLLAILIAFGVMTSVARKADLAWAKARWIKLEPEMNKVIAQRQLLQSNQAKLKALEEWQRTRYLTHEVLRDFRSSVPTNVQIRRLSIRCQSMQENEEKWECVLEIDGNAKSELAEDVVVGFRRDILALPSIKETFESLKLLSFRKVTTGEDKGTASFQLRGQGVME